MTTATRRLARAAALLLLACSRRPDVPPHGLDCVLEAGASRVECTHIAEHSQVQKPVLTGAHEMVLTSLTASRTPTHLVVDATLQGAFRNAEDQNLYLFLGEPGPEGTRTPYALTADLRYAQELSYPVRAGLELPHRVDVRVGVMTPGPAGYSPQVYVRDTVHADAVGADSEVVQRVEGADVHLEVPLARYYALKGASVPPTLSVTLATARDYVGFVDHLTVRDVAPGETRNAAPRAAPPVLYPSLDARSHRLEAVSLSEAGGTTTVRLKVGAPMTDWAQTNLQFFFVPLPATSPPQPLMDPSHAVSVPYAWSYYCAVYSPGQIFCKASRGEDFTYDTAYAERTSLARPEGVRFLEEGPARYALEVPTAALGAGPGGVALLVALGRDGFAPIHFYGVAPSGKF
ncbi:hypothetical protein P2318_33955 [Myxococcaceae bacterium GXIMD 01537]